MIRGLLEKELRQHGFTFAFLGVLLLGGLILIGANEMLRRAGGGGFLAVQVLLMLFAPLACLVLGQILIATEFRQKTQLFLEALPLPRWRMLAVKFALGLTSVLGATALALALAWWKARHTEAMTPRFALVLALKSAGWVWFLFTLCFAHAFLGRYRIMFGVLVLFGTIFASQSGVEIAAFGPFALVDQRFAFERLLLPERALAITAALGFVLAGLGFALGLVRDATVAALLAEKMSSREKVFMTMLILVGFIVGSVQYDRIKAVAPVQIPGTVETQRGVARVAASAAVDAPSRAETAALQAATRRTADQLGELAEYLRCRSFPAIYIVHRRDLEARERIDGNLKPTQGVMVRVNLTTEKFDDPALQDWLLRHALIIHTGLLAGRERNAWVLDGFTWWWRHSQHGKVNALDETARTPARSAMPADFSERSLRRWYSTRKKMGEKKARQFAGIGLAVLAERKGAESVRDFLSAMLGVHEPADTRGWWHDMINPAPARLRATTGWTEADLVREWRAALAEPANPQP
jgi:acyl dehydratase